MQAQSLLLHLKEEARALQTVLIIMAARVTLVCEVLVMRADAGLDSPRGIPSIHPFESPES